MTNNKPQKLQHPTQNTSSQAVFEHLEALSLQMDVLTVQLINAGTSTNTNRSYRSALKQFVRWNTLSNPFQDQHVAQYLSDLHVSRRLAPTSISLALAP